VGLTSALNTALTGLSGAETTIDVVGNNLANSNTVGFKAAHVSFATQFLQTLSPGSGPTVESGGTNPRQIGLGTMVAEITPNFTQGTIQISANPMDMAIQGDGFFIVAGEGNEQLYSRNGIFKLNADNQLVTTTGNRILGYGVNDQYEIQTTLVPIEVPVGQELVAQATRTAVLEGALSPVGDVADAAEIIQTDVLRNGAYRGPSASPTVAASSAGNLSGEYTYYVTFSDGAAESLPSPISSKVTVDNQRIDLTAIPPVPADNPNGWTQRRIYRNAADDPDTFYLVTTINDPDTTSSFTDNVDDATLLTNPTLDFDRHRITGSTALVDVLRHDGSGYEQLFQAGKLEFTGRKGGRTLETKELEITDTTTVNDLLQFMEQSLGILKTSGDPANPLNQSDTPGGSVQDGRIVFVGNNGEANAIEIGLSGLQLVQENGSTQNVNMPFGSTQSATGSGAVTDFIVYDSLGIPLRVRMTAVLESRDGTSTSYRWFADSPDNDPLSGSAIAVGTGVITFDGNGNLVNATDSTVNINRQNFPSSSPMSFDLDFSQLSGLPVGENLLALSRQDGSAPGVMSSFLIGEDGIIRAVFSNGVSRTIGQVRLARFANPTGLEQRAENLFAEGVNSGLPVVGSPGQQGIGTIVAGAVELSNTDIGGNLIDLILASTMYRGNTRVITTAQQMLDELLALRR
jgi:flagellar hook protein FlgE